MRESSTYQAMFEEGRREGRIEALHEVLLLLGRQKFGRLTKAETQALTSIMDEARLFRQVDAILTASTWQELLAPPCP